MKWIKVNERQPDKKGVYKIKGLNNQGNPVEDEIWWTGLSYHDGFIIREGCKVLEWLDDSEVFSTQSELEELREVMKGIVDVINRPYANDLINLARFVAWAKIGEDVLNGNSISGELIKEMRGKRACKDIELPEIKNVPKLF